LLVRFADEFGAGNDYLEGYVRVDAGFLQLQYHFFETSLVELKEFSQSLAGIRDGRSNTGKFDSYNLQLNLSPHSTRDCLLVELRLRICQDIDGMLFTRNGENWAVILGEFILELTYLHTMVRLINEFVQMVEAQLEPESNRP